MAFIPDIPSGPALCAASPRVTTVPVSAVVKKLLEDALVAEGEIEITPTPSRESASRGSILAPLTDPHCAPPVDEVPTRGGVLVRLGGTGRSVSGR